VATTNVAHNTSTAAFPEAPKPPTKISAAAGRTPIWKAKGSARTY